MGCYGNGEKGLSSFLSFKLGNGTRYEIQFRHSSLRMRTANRKCSQCNSSAFSRPEFQFEYAKRESVGVVTEKAEYEKFVLSREGRPGTALACSEKLYTPTLTFLAGEKESERTFTKEKKFVIASVVEKSKLKPNIPSEKVSLELKSLLTMLPKHLLI